MKKMSNSNFKKLLKTTKKNSVMKTYDIGEDQTVNIEISPTISVIDRSVMIQNIVDCLFIDEEYQGYLYTTIKWYWILKYFTNLPIGDLTEKDHNNGTLSANTLDNILALVQKTQIPFDIEEVVGCSEIESIEKELNDMIEFQKQMVVQKASAFNKIMDALNDLLSSLSNSAKSLEGLDPHALKEAIGKIKSIDENKILDFVAKK